MTSFIARDSLLLRTAIENGRVLIARYLEPDGMPGDRCLDELLALFFHPALDDAAGAAPATPSDHIGILQRAVADSRTTLLRHFGPEGSLRGSTCLDRLIGILDAPELVQAGGFSPIITVKVVDLAPPSQPGSRRLH